ncbi:MAG: hypothetical protein KIS29_10700 [Thermoplasmata archaeon]|nr:hypothetical protein [Candidatus Sysuiplasma jiujiangense]
MTVIVQQPTDSNGNPQPMVYDQDTGKIIVDSNGYVINGGKRLVNVPTKADYVSTLKTQTLGIMDAINYVYSQNGGKIKIMPGFYDLTNAPLLANTDSTRYSKIMFPFIAYTTKQVPIIIEGSGTQEQLGEYSENGTVIYDGTTTLTETYQSVIDANGSSSAGFNGVEISLLNLAVVPYSGATGISAIDFSYDMTCIFDNIFTQPNHIDTPVSPATGIKFPQMGCEISYAGLISIGGFYNGILSGEHMHINYLQIESCVNGISTSDLTHDMNIVQAAIGACEISIYNANTNLTSMLWIGKIQVADRTSPYGGTVKYYIQNNINPASPIYIGVWHEASSPVLASLNIGIANNNGTNVYGLINIGKVYPQDFVDTTLIANPPVSGTVYQNTNPYGIRLKIPITYNPSTSAAATLATGISSTSTVTTSTKVSLPSGLTAADGQILTYDMVVPAGWYYELVVTNATIGTVEVEAV